MPGKSTSLITRVAAAALAVGLVTVVVIILVILRDAKKMTWYDQTTGRVNHIAYSVKFYKDLVGEFPASLNDADWTKCPDPDIKKVLDTELHDLFNNSYRYQRLTNGFLIVVTEPDGFLHKGNRFEKKYVGADAEYKPGKIE